MTPRKKTGKVARGFHNRAAARTYAATRRIYAAEWRRLHLRGSPGKIAGDPEISAFVDERLPNMTFGQIAAACAKRFGRGRAPGKSAVHRYWLKFRALLTRGDKDAG